MKSNFISRSAKVSGFTIIELMVTFVILAVLSTVAVPLTKVAIQRNKEQELKAALRQVREALDAYKLASDEGRIAKSMDESGYPSSLKLLEEGVEDIKDPKRRLIYFIRRIPRDPMSDALDIAPDATWNKRSYQSSFDHPEEGKDVYDIYSQSSNTGLNGIPYREW